MKWKEWGITPSIDVHIQAAEFYKAADRVWEDSKKAAAMLTAITILQGTKGDEQVTAAKQLISSKHNQLLPDSILHAARAVAALPYAKKHLCSLRRKKTAE